MHLSSYYSNCKSANTWTERVNLIGEKVLKPRINFCEYCSKPILVYGRLIPCKHVFCYGCASLCMSSTNNNNNQPQSNESNQLSTPNGRDGPNNEAIKDNDRNQILDDNTKQHRNSSIVTDNLNNNNNDVDHVNRTAQMNTSKPNQNVCHRCGGRALRIERNALGSVFVCQVTNCRRTYLSARDLQAHVTHRHNKNNDHASRNNSTVGSLAAISSSPFISSSTLNHLNSQAHNSHHSGSPSTNGNHHNRENRDSRHSSRDAYQRERERERDSKEYHRQSLQRAAQWAEASASLFERGFNRERIQ